MHVHHASSACQFHHFPLADSVSLSLKLAKSDEHSMTKYETSPLHYGDKFLELRQITDASRANGRSIDGNVNSPYHGLKVLWRVVVASLTVTAKGQVTLKRDLLQHLGVEPGERIDVEKLPNGELRIRAMQPIGSIDGFLGLLAGKTRKIATIEEMNEAASAGWAGKK
jgi:hypothetical protein